MTTPFGPRLIGETEKTLNAVLRRILDGTDLTESQWVTLRLAELLDGGVDRSGLVAAVQDRAHIDDAAELVEALGERGLLAGGRLSAAGSTLVAEVRSTIAARTSSVWDGLPVDDVAAATRVLNEVVERARLVLA